MTATSKAEAIDAAFWHERWERQEIGFHLPDVHAALPRFWPAVGAARRVLVPLCGKSVDLRWIWEQGQEVLGVELSAVAIEAFFAEQGLPFEIDEAGPFRRYRTDGICLLQGDFFALSPEFTEGVMAVYDRAALIALPLDMQQAYVAHLASLLPHRPPMLLITLEYDPQEMSGPPFATPAARVAALYGDAYRIRELGAEDILTTQPGLRNRGVSALIERTYLLTAGI